MDLSLLLLLWASSILLAGASLVLMLVLIILRWLRSIRMRRDKQIRDALFHELMMAGEEAGEQADVPETLVKRPRITAQVLLEFSTLVRGGEFEAALDKLRRAGAERRILALLTSRNREDCLAAAEALGFFGTKQARDALTNVLSRRVSLRLKIAAGRALLAMGERPDIGDLLSAFDIDDTVAPGELSAILTAIATGEPEVLSHRLEQDIDPPSVRAMMIDVMGRAGVYGALPLLLSEACNSDVRIRAAAVDALGRLGLPEAKETLAAAIDDPEPDVRAEAAEAIGQAALVDLMPALEARLSDFDWGVRFRAANALVELGEDGRKRLRLIADGKGERGARTAALVLAERAMA